MPDRSIGTLLKSAAALILLLSSVTPSIGADLTIWTHPLGAFVQMSGPTKLQGISPLPLDNRMNGEYDVRIRLGGYEEARGRMTLRSRDGSLALSSYKTNLRYDRFFRSLVLPGYGQMSGGRTQPGLTWLTTCLGFGVSALVLDGKYQDAHDDYVLANNQLQEAARSGAVDEQTAVPLFGNAFDLWVESNNRKRSRDAVAMATAAFWAGNLVDAVFFHGGLDVREGSDGVVQIGLNRKNRTRRVIRSALLPGLGQSYSGSSTRGALYSAAAVFAGILALESHLDYKQEGDRIDAIILQRGELARQSFLTPENSEALAASQRGAVNDQEDEKERRKLWMTISAAVWTASILDAVFLGPPESAAVEPGAELSFKATPHTQSPGIALQVRF